MAKKKKNGPNISETIREHLKAHPEMGPTEMAAAVSKQVGKKVAPSFVSNVKAKMSGGGKKKRKAKRGGSDGVGIMPPSANERVNGKEHGDIFDAMKLIRRAVEIIGAEMAKKAADLFGGK